MSETPRPLPWRHIEPLRELSADVPVPVVLDMAEGTMAVQLTHNQTLFVDGTGAVSNEHGTFLFRVKRPSGGRS